MAERITKAQIARIWAMASGLGLDREMLYLLVPRGSIRAMTQEEARELIEHLASLAEKRRSNAPPVPAPEIARDPNAPTPQQRHFIYFMLGRLGWLQDPGHARNFLLKYAGAPTVEQIATRQKASAIIEALKAILNRKRAAAHSGPG